MEWNGMEWDGTNEIGCVLMMECHYMPWDRMEWNGITIEDGMEWVLMVE